MESECPVQYEAPEGDPTPEPDASCAPWAQPPEGQAFPSRPWARHVVTTLAQHGHLPASLANHREANLQVWSDCSGINTEMFALRELSQSLKQVIDMDVTWNLYFTCDSDAQSIKFTKANHHPRHVGTNMVHRNFESGKFWCSSCKENHDLPRRGMDLYVGTYPCSPWSRRGKRTGFDHPAVEAFRIGIETIAFLQPAVWIIELGELPEQTAVDQVTMEIQERLGTAGVVAYTMQPLRNLTPAWSGYPIKRTRFFMLGWRSDLGAPGEVTGPLSTLIQHPLAVEQSYRGFLGLARTIDWSHVGEYPSGPELAYIMSSSCRCSANPLTTCPQHFCKCNHCGDDSVSCVWRGLLMAFLEKEGLAMQAADAGKMTYVQLLEMNGLDTPQLPRSRVILNAMALLPRAKPLTDTLLLGDTSQNPPYMSLAVDGLVPTLTTTSAVWCVSAGKYLQVWELAALMAVKTSEITFVGHSESWFRTRLGLAVHVGNFGLALMALMAVPLNKLFSA